MTKFFRSLSILAMTACIIVPATFPATGRAANVSRTDALASLADLAYFTATIDVTSTNCDPDLLSYDFFSLRLNETNQSKVKQATIYFSNATWTTVKGSMKKGKTGYYVLKLKANTSGGNITYTGRVKKSDPTYMYKEKVKIRNFKGMDCKVNADLQ